MITFSTFYKVPGKRDSYFTTHEQATKYSPMGVVEEIRVFETVEDKKKFEALAKLSSEEKKLLGLPCEEVYVEENEVKILEFITEDLFRFALSARVVNVFREQKFTTLRDVILYHQTVDKYSVHKRKSGLCRLRKFGTASLLEIESLLNENGASLDMKMSHYS